MCAYKVCGYITEHSYVSRTQIKKQKILCWLSSRESACNAGDVTSIPGSGRSHGEGNGNPLQYSCLENPMDRRAWQATVHGVTRVGYDLATNPPPHVYQASLHHFSSEGGRLPVAGTIMVRLWPPQWEARCASM